MSLCLSIQPLHMVDVLLIKVHWGRFVLHALLNLADCMRKLHTKKLDHCQCTVDVKLRLTGFGLADNQNSSANWV